MRQRGKRSAADLQSIPLDARRRRLEPPADLTPTEATLFRQVVANCPADHFVASDGPLLISYVQATLLSRRSMPALMEDASMVGVWEKATRMQTVLATKLRICPQSRADAKTVARKQAAHHVSAYDHPLWAEKND